ncbi:hypothetical protein [Sphaerisporangium sp. NPDC051011]|uniref:hypothetical protein n=1 Tax=Sphaerisporangium sp. NPDC051011 TaxID=3155792 RepID=UPI003411E94C
MLAVVQDQQERPVGQRLSEASGGAGGSVGQGRPPRAAQAQRAQHGLRHLRRLGHPREVGEAHLARLPCAGLGREPGLARAARAGQRHQAGGGQQLGEPSQLVLTSHEAGQRRGDGPAAASRGRGAGGERGVAAEDRQVGGRQLGGGVGAEFVGEHAPAVLVGRERLGLPPGAVQGAHQLGA